MNKGIPHILVILGPTASGKTNIACSVAQHLSGEIISADSRQVYRHMDIGTGKDIEEYTIDGKQIPYHLIDIKDPGYKYNIAEYQLDFLSALNDINQKSKTPILCGGSGLYIETALKGNSFLGIPMEKDRREALEELSEEELLEAYDNTSEKVRNVINNETSRRMVRAIIVDEYLKEHPNFKTIDIPEFQYTIIGVDIERELRRQKISDRLSFRMNNGLIEEVEWLLENYLSQEDLEYYGLEYKWIGLYLKKEITKKELFEGLRTAIHQFAKRQMTWFRRMERNGFHINWIDAAIPLEDKVQRVISIYQEKQPSK